jgi:hypothetical protein
MQGERQPSTLRIIRVKSPHKPKDSGVRDVPGTIALAIGNGENGLLTSAEILEELDLQAGLVILSACDTGLCDITGDGVMSSCLSGRDRMHYCLADD